MNEIKQEDQNKVGPSNNSVQQHSKSTLTKDLNSVATNGRGHEVAPKNANNQKKFVSNRRNNIQRNRDKRDRFKKNGPEQEKGKGSLSVSKAPWRKGLSIEMLNQVTELVTSLDGTFSEQEVCNTLRSFHFDVVQTREALIARKNKLWSAVAQKSLQSQGPVPSTAAEQTHSVPAASVSVLPPTLNSAPNVKSDPTTLTQANSTSQISSDSKNTSSEVLSTSEDKKVIDPENLQKAIEANLSKWLDIRKEFEAIAETTNKQIQALAAEKKSLEEKKRNLEEELANVTSRLQALDAEISRLEKERIERLRILDEKSKSLQTPLSSATTTPTTK
jgi:predicted  nucleic acid-binding Zn-ribbon protein